MEGGTRTTAPARLLELDRYGTEVSAAALAVAEAYAEADAQAAYDAEIEVAIEAAAAAAAEEIASSLDPSSDPTPAASGSTAPAETTEVAPTASEQEPISTPAPE